MRTSTGLVGHLGFAALLLGVWLGDGGIEHRAEAGPRPPQRRRHADGGRPAAIHPRDVRKPVERRRPRGGGPFRFQPLPVPARARGPRPASPTGRQGLGESGRGARPEHRRRVPNGTADSGRGRHRTAPGLVGLGRARRDPLEPVVGSPRSRARRVEDDAGARRYPGGTRRTGHPGPRDASKGVCTTGSSGPGRSSGGRPDSPAPIPGSGSTTCRTGSGPSGTASPPASAT